MASHFDFNYQQPWAPAGTFNAEDLLLPVYGQQHDDLFFDASFSDPTWGTGPANDIPAGSLWPPLEVQYDATTNNGFDFSFMNDAAVEMHQLIQPVVQAPLLPVLPAAGPSIQHNMLPVVQPALQPILPITGPNTEHDNIIPHTSNGRQLFAQTLEETTAHVILRTHRLSHKGRKDAVYKTRYDRYRQDWKTANQKRVREDMKLLDGCSVLRKEWKEAKRLAIMRVLEAKVESCKAEGLAYPNLLAYGADAELEYNLNGPAREAKKVTKAAKKAAKNVRNQAQEQDGEVVASSSSSDMSRTLSRSSGEESSPERMGNAGIQMQMQNGDVVAWPNCSNLSMTLQEEYIPEIVANAGTQMQMQDGSMEAWLSCSDASRTPEERYTLEMAINASRQMHMQERETAALPAVPNMLGNEMQEQDEGVVASPSTVDSSQPLLLQYTPDPDMVTSQDTIDDYLMPEQMSQEQLENEFGWLNTLQDMSIELP